MIITKPIAEHEAFRQYLIFAGIISEEVPLRWNTGEPVINVDKVIREWCEKNGSKWIPGEFS